MSDGDTAIVLSNLRYVLMHPHNGQVVAGKGKYGFFDSLEEMLGQDLNYVYVLRMEGGIHTSNPMKPNFHKEILKMLQRDIVDQLYAHALRRYKKERPDFKFTNEFADSLWYSIEGVLNHKGEDTARNYVKNAPLVELCK